MPEPEGESGELDDLVVSGLIGDDLLELLAGILLVGHLDLGQSGLKRYRGSNAGERVERLFYMFAAVLAHHAFHLECLLCHGVCIWN